MPRAAVYLRVSDRDQSLASQRHEIKQWLESNPIADLRWYEDHGESSKTLARPGMARLREDIAKGKIDTVIVQRLDRVSRRLVDGLTLLANWAENGIRVIAIKQQIDMSGPVGRLIAAVLLGVAEMELELRRERQRAGIEAAKLRGVYKGRKHGTRKIIDQKAVALRARGLSYRHIAKLLGVSVNTVYSAAKRIECSQSDIILNSVDGSPLDSSSS